MPDEKTLLCRDEGATWGSGWFPGGQSGSQTVSFPGPAVRAAAGS